MSTALTTHKISEIYTIPIDLLLLYEREGVVVPWRIGNERYYSTRDRVRIEIILQGRRLGFSLHEVKQLIFSHLPGRGTPALDPMALDDQIKRLEHEMLDLQAAIDALRALAKTDGLSTEQQ